MDKCNKNFAHWPYYGKEEIKAAADILRSGKVNQWTNPEVFRFEKEYADYLGVKHCVALANGSVALDAALNVLGIDSGDEVIVPARTFVASANCVALRKATPIFADVDYQSGNIDIASAEKICTAKTKALIAVHLAGWPCVLDELKDFCKKKKIYLIEDCAQAHGAKYKDKPVGSFGDVACFSFCQDKIITTAGEGGLLATNNNKFWKTAWSFKDHGKSYDKVFNKKKGANFVWAVDSFGTNYRLTAIQAAIGRVMLRKLDNWVEKRRKSAAILDKYFARIPGLRMAIPNTDFYHAYYKYYVYLQPERLKLGWSRDRILDWLIKEGINCGCGSCPEVYLENAFKRPQQKRLPIAKKLGETSIMFHVHPRLTDGNMYYIIDKVKKILHKATK